MSHDEPLCEHGCLPGEPCRATPCPALANARDAARRPPDDTRCPTCGGSAHALSAEAAPKFGREYQHRHARKRLDEAWWESDRLAIENESTYAHLRAVIENCAHSPVDAIRHQLVGLLPEVREIEPERRQKMLDAGMGHLVERHEAQVRENWAAFGYPSPGRD